MTGKQIRMKRLFSFHSHRSILLPVDHGVSLGPIPGLFSLYNVIERFVHTGKINGIIGHRRVCSILSEPYIPSCSAILHLSASTQLANSNNKVLVANVEDAIILGADAVSLHINLGEVTESNMLEQLGSVISHATQYGLPVLAMFYVRNAQATSYSANDIAHCVRIADDIGADMVKVPYTGSTESFTRVIESCSIPVFIAGGERSGNAQDILNMVDGALKAGAKGISIGRNIFDTPYPEQLLDALELLVHKNATLHSASMLYNTAVAHIQHSEQQ